VLSSALKKVTVGLGSRASIYSGRAVPSVAEVTRRLLIYPFKFKFDCLNMNSTV
jgi:hypothetical protein